MLLGNAVVTVGLVLATAVIPLFRTLFLPRVSQPEILDQRIRIPAGAFWMGCDPAIAEENCTLFDEVPLHVVTLDAYSIERYEVTNSRYAACVAAGGCTAPLHVYSATRDSYYDNAGYADYPVVWVNWFQARDFCTWNGGRLPTEAEWEKAARGTFDTRKYPWGNATPNCSLANYRGGDPACGADTARVGASPAGMSGYGIFDMAGNVYEWTNDWYASKYYGDEPVENPPGPDTGTFRVTRGGAFSTRADTVRVANRGGTYPATATVNDGFRCAYDP